jgi:hypothetical protein
MSRGFFDRYEKLLYAHLIKDFWASEISLKNKTFHI